MSEPLRVGLVCEGPTDKIVLEALLGEIVDRDVVVALLQPTEEAIGGRGDSHGLGWRGVRGWCHDHSAGAAITLDDLLSQHALVIIHLDGDVAREPDVQCARPCPPAQHTADALRALVLSDLGLTVSPPRLVITTPMDATEAWLLPILRGVDWAECVPDPAAQFIGGTPKLMNQQRKKQTRRYRDEVSNIRAHWRRALPLSQLERFVREVQRALPSP